MPNWCLNVVEIRGNKEDLADLKKDLQSLGAAKSQTLFKDLVGWPEGSDSSTKLKIEEINQEHFGSKWDVTYESARVQYEKDCITFFPKTPWTPPIDFCKNLAIKYGQEVMCTYDEDVEMLRGTAFCSPDGTVHTENYQYTEEVYVRDKQHFLDSMASEIDIALEYVFSEFKTDDLTDQNFVDYVDEQYPYITDEDKQKVIKMLKDCWEEGNEKIRLEAENEAKEE